MPLPPPDRFPEPDEDGAVLVGGELTNQWLLRAYSQGVFPWPFVDHEGEWLVWSSPAPRAILPLDRLQMSGRSRRRIRNSGFRYSVNTAFSKVVEACAVPRDDGGIWLTGSLAEAYVRLNAVGHAVSFEAWREDTLVGGLLGVHIGGFFSAESMFHRQPDAGNATLLYFVERAQSSGIALVDIQQMSPHMEARGAIEITRKQYLKELATAIELPHHRFNA